jgi:ribosome maturation factor RimP
MNCLFDLCVLFLYIKAHWSTGLWKASFLRVGFPHFFVFGNSREWMNTMIDDLIHKAIGESMAELSAVSGNEMYLVEAAIRGGGRKIELTVDTDKGVSIDQCAKLSRAIRARLEACEEHIMLAEGDFDLLVSSPGIGEPIRVRRQYLRHLGRLIRVNYLDAEKQQQEITGHLLEAAVGAEVEEPSITIEAVKEGRKKRTAGEAPVTLRLSDVVKAVVQASF